MHRSILAVLLFLPLLLLSSCDTPPTAAEIKGAHYGHYPSDYRSATRELLEARHQNLGDPFNVVSVSKPQKDYTGDAANRTWGYSSEVVYNAPNQAVGATVYVYREKVFFHNDKVVDVKTMTNAGDVMSSIVANNLASLQGQVATNGDQSGDDQSGSDDGSGDDGSGTSSSGNKHRGTSSKTGSARVAARKKTGAGASKIGGVKSKPVVQARPAPAPVKKK